MDQEKIGKFISKLRKENNMTQEKLAEELNVSVKTISRWENGKNMPDLSLFKPLCELFNITFNDLMSGEIVKKNEYNTKLEENIINLSISDNKKIKLLKYIIFSILLVLLLITLYGVINNTYVMEYVDNSLLNCDINDNNLKIELYGFTSLNPGYYEFEYNNEKYIVINTLRLYFSKNSFENDYFNVENTKELDPKYKIYINIKIDDKIKVVYLNKTKKELLKMNKDELENIFTTSKILCNN